MAIGIIPTVPGSSHGVVSDDLNARIEEAALIIPESVKSQYEAHAMQILNAGPPARSTRDAILGQTVRIVSEI